MLGRGWALAVGLEGQANGPSTRTGEDQCQSEKSIATLTVDLAMTGTDPGDRMAVCSSVEPGSSKGEGVGTCWVA